MFMGYIIFSFFFLSFFSLFSPILRRMRLERFRESGFFLMAMAIIVMLHYAGTQAWKYEWIYW